MSARGDPQVDRRAAEADAGAGAAIARAKTRTELEDLYLPYRPKRRTRATIAREKGLEPLGECDVGGRSRARACEASARSAGRRARYLRGARRGRCGAAEVRAGEGHTRGRALLGGGARQEGVQEQVRDVLRPSRASGRRAVASRAGHLPRGERGGAERAAALPRRTDRRRAEGALQSSDAVPRGEDEGGRGRLETAALGLAGRGAARRPQTARRRARPSKSSRRTCASSCSRRRPATGACWRSIPACAPASRWPCSTRQASCSRPPRSTPSNRRRERANAEKALLRMLDAAPAGPHRRRQRHRLARGGGFVREALGAERLPIVSVSRAGGVDLFGVRGRARRVPGPRPLRCAAPSPSDAACRIRSASW